MEELDMRNEGTTCHMHPADSWLDSATNLGEIVILECFVATFNDFSLFCLYYLIFTEVTMYKGRSNNGIK